MVSCLPEYKRSRSYSFTNCAYNMKKRLSKYEHCGSNCNLTARVDIGKQMDKQTSKQMGSWNPMTCQGKAYESIMWLPCHIKSFGLWYDNHCTKTCGIASTFSFSHFNVMHLWNGQFWYCLKFSLWVRVFLALCYTCNTHLSQLTRLWYFSSSVNSNAHAQPSSGARCLVPHSSCVRTAKLWRRTALMRRLAWAFAGRLCEKYHNLMNWLIFSLWNRFDNIF